MKKSIKNTASFLTGIVIFSFLLIGTNSFAGGGQNEKPAAKPWPCPEKYAKMVNPIKPDAGILAAGKDVWEKQCRSCHGKTGKGDGTKAKNLNVALVDFTTDEYQNKSDGELFWRVTEGKKPMPTNKEKISDIERWSVVLYTRTFAKKMDTVEAIRH